MLPYRAQDLARSFRTVRKNTLQAAEEIPADQYGFRAAPGCRTVEKQLTHIALLHRFQHRLHGIEKRATLEGFDFPALMAELAAEEAIPRTKADVVALLEAEGELYATFVEQLTDDFLAERVTFPAGGPDASKTRFEMLLSVKEHEMHHRGQIMLTQRMLGLVPHLTREREARMAQTR